MNIKFPKEEIRIIESIRTAIVKQDYLTLLSHYDDILKYCNFYNKYYNSVLNIYIETLFQIKEYEKMIALVEDLRKQKIENSMWYFYIIAYLISQKDFYYAKTIINKSKLLASDSIKYLIDSDDADYNAIFNLHSVILSTIGPCLIIINFLNELLVEANNIKIDDEYILMRYFDLLNLLYEYGLDKEIIDIFIKTIEKLYEIKID